MGIRYYAYPLRPDHLKFAVQEPRAFIAPDPFADIWRDDPPQMLYLDKCWGLLQGLTGPQPGDPARPAYRLFEGDVTHVDYGWIPWCRALSPDEVRDVADDLQTITEDDVDRYCRRMSSARSEDRSERKEYLVSYLTSAQEFTVTMSQAGQGLVYMIG